MLVLKTIAETRAWCARLRAEGKTLGLVPTMGALHAGHLALVQAARAGCDAVGVSIFVNPTQFGPNEDFASYPRTFEEDCRKLQEAGVDVVFAPAAEEMFPANATTFVTVGGLSERLDGKSRPGHFRGVATQQPCERTGLRRRIVDAIQHHRDSDRLGWSVYLREFDAIGVAAGCADGDVQRVADEWHLRHAGH